MGEIEFVRAMRTTGMSNEQAETLVQQIEQVIDQRVATKGDLNQLHFQLKAEMSRVETKIGGVQNSILAQSGTFDGKLGRLEAKLTWLIAGAVIFNGGISLLVKHFG